MYKMLLSLRYLRSRYIALASIISVMLGVATMIVVNSVMSGFRHEMNHRLHGILSDVVFESHSQDGFEDPEGHMKIIRQIIGEDKLVGMTATVHVPALLRIPVAGGLSTRQVTLVGIDEKTYAQVGDFSQYLIHPENRKRLSFLLRDAGYQDRLPDGGWDYRQRRIAYQQQFQDSVAEFSPSHDDSFPQSPHDPSPSYDSESRPPEENSPSSVDDPFAATQLQANNAFDESTEQYPGIILGIAIGSVRHRGPDGKVKDSYYCLPGDDVIVTVPTVGTDIRGSNSQFTIVDFYESKMSEYDSNFAFVPLEKLQRMRGMGESVTSIQIKVREGVDLNEVRDAIQAQFPPATYFSVRTWRDMQGPLLAAVQMETAILNVLLFLIIAVAGFGILATFYMIVVEKTRDIGILKSLGASGSGIMSIFLAYGFSLGIVGSGVGMVIGLLFVANINTIAKLLEKITGQEVFDPTVYYFQEIPTIISPFSIAWIVSGAIIIAVMASILPAFRAARLRPVEALRYE